MQAAPPTTMGAWSMAVVLWQQYDIIISIISIRTSIDIYGISRARYTITHFKYHHRVLRLISNRMSV